MAGFTCKLRYNPIAPLLESKNAAVDYFAQADLLEENPGPLEHIWRLPEVLKIVKKQLPDGNFKTAKVSPGSGEKYELVEKWRQLRYLVDQYQMDKSHPAIERAAEYLFSCQSKDGDIRGILGNQYAPYYTGAILYLLIKAGYANDPRVEAGIRWLLSMRQSDGGWMIGSPGMARCTWKEILALTSVWTVEPMKDFDKSLPFSAAGTGMAIRALAVHPVWQNSEEAGRAAKLLCSKFFCEDNYSWYHHPDNWIRFQFPYWWNHLVSALDMATLIGLGLEEESIHRAVDWLAEHQQASGLWKRSYSSIHKPDTEESDESLWISLAVCRILKRIYK